VARGHGHFTEQNSRARFAPWNRYLWTDVQSFIDRANGPASSRWAEPASGGEWEAAARGRSNVRNWWVPISEKASLTAPTFAGSSDSPRPKRCRPIPAETPLASLTCSGTSGSGVGTSGTRSYTGATTGRHALGGIGRGSRVRRGGSWQTSRTQLRSSARVPGAFELQGWPNRIPVRVVDRACERRLVPDPTLPRLQDRVGACE